MAGNRPSEGCLLQVGECLDLRGVATARLVCTSWSSGIALGVTHLRPKLTGAAGKA